MQRRSFLTSAPGAALLPSLAANAPKGAVFELRTFFLRNGDQVQRASDFFGNYFVPGAQRLGIGPVGIFSPAIGERSPSVLLLISHPSWDALETTRERLMTDSQFRKGFEQYHSASEPAYIRTENSVMRAFAGMPALQAPAASPQRPNRIFELRIYESNNPITLSRKIRMFNEGEIQIFQRLGMAPVFFGETVVGRNLPNLTYMLAFDDLAAREKLWSAFSADPEWQKMRAQPGVSDGEIVSSISNSILRPLPFSPIR